MAKTQAAFRKEVYDYLSGNGIDLAPDVREGLKGILKSVYEHKVIETPNPVPATYTITCPKCLGVVTKIGKWGKAYFRMRKGAAEFSEKNGENIA